MTAIYKKELKSYLTSMVGYLFMAFTLALFGLYFLCMAGGSFGSLPVGAGTKADGFHKIPPIEKIPLAA